MVRHGLSDEQWAVLQLVLLPVASTGRPPHDRRRIIDGILYVLKTGCAWRDLPAEFDKWSTVYERFRLWSHSGVWEQILAALQARKQASGEIDWDLFGIDGTVIRVHKAAAGGSNKRELMSPLTMRWDGRKAGLGPSCTCCVTHQAGC